MDASDADATYSESSYSNDSTSSSKPSHTSEEGLREQGGDHDREQHKVETIEDYRSRFPYDSSSSEHRSDAHSNSPTSTRLGDGTVVVLLKLFQKKLQPTDIETPNCSLVIPSIDTQNLPELQVDEMDGEVAGDIELTAEVHDRDKRRWPLLFCYRASIRSYLFTVGWSAFVIDKQLKVRDVIVLYKCLQDNHQEHMKEWYMVDVIRDGEEAVSPSSSISSQTRTHEQGKEVVGGDVEEGEIIENDKSGTEDGEDAAEGEITEDYKGGNEDREEEVAKIVEFMGETPEASKEKIVMNNTEREKVEGEVEEGKMDENNVSGNEDGEEVEKIGEAAGETSETVKETIDLNIHPQGREQEIMAKVEGEEEEGKMDETSGASRNEEGEEASETPKETMAVNNTSQDQEQEKTLEGDIEERPRKRKVIRLFGVEIVIDQKIKEEEEEEKGGKRRKL
ncbi:hypothetical protein BHM03_00063019 [Ensete ventricosum]|nr:hypothetical protein BHM03_00063019 [Ensete ventricosum]